MKDYSAVLFDLDGTVADSAPDLAYCLNEMLAARKKEKLPLERVRSYASSGARGLLSIGFSITPNHSEYDSMRKEFLELYEKNLMRYTKLFDGIEQLIDSIEKADKKWGIVTNKSHKFTVPVLDGLKILQRASSVVSGDTTDHPKPHPDPLLKAANDLNVIPDKCIYIGDDERDIVAATAAGMDSIAVEYGYLGNNKPPNQWGANDIAKSPKNLARLIGLESHSNANRISSAT